MSYEKVDEYILGLSPTPFFLHFTTRENWDKIQKEGLVPQPQSPLRRSMDGEPPLSENLIWLGREPIEAYDNRAECPIVIALPLLLEDYGLRETIADAEATTDKSIPTTVFLGVFDFAEQPEGKEGSAFAEWLDLLGN